MIQPPTPDESILEPMVGGQALMSQHWMFQVPFVNQYDQDTGFLSPFQQEHALGTEVLLRLQG